MGWTTEHLRDQRDRTAVVTGANSGIGFEVTKALAESGATVVMACRSEDRARNACHRIREETPDPAIMVERMDLASLDSIEGCANRLGDAISGIDLLVNNAGVMGIPRRETADGFERQFGVNHLGHFAFTGAVLDLLEMTGRVVTVSSGMHRRGRIDFDDLHSERNYGRWRAYADSKLANILFAYELDRRLEEADRRTISVAAEPGYCATRLQERSARGSTLRTTMMKLSNALFAQSARAGARPILYAGTEPHLFGRAYFAPDRLAHSRGFPTEIRSSEASYDRETARRLWEVSEALTGASYPPGHAESSRETGATPG